MNIDDTTVQRWRWTYNANAGIKSGIHIPMNTKLIPHGLWLATVESKLIVTSEPDSKLMKEAVSNIHQNRGGLAGQLVVEQATDDEVQLLDLRVHASRLAFLYSARLRSEDPPDGKPVKGELLSRITLQATRRELTVDVLVPRADFLRSLQAEF